MLTRHANAADFLAAAQPALQAEEAANNLILGLALRILRKPDSVYRPPYFATVSDTAGLAAAAVITPPFNLVPWATRPGAQAALDVIAADLRASDWPVPGVAARAPTSDEFRDVWLARTGARVSHTIPQRIYQLDRVVAPPWPAGAARFAGDEDVAVIAEWMEAFTGEAIGTRTDDDWGSRARERIGAGDVLIWEAGGRPVSLAARSRVLPRGAVVSLVYTPVEQRGRGYASAIVAALSQSLLDAGHTYCALYTDPGNTTSNSIYQKIGYRPVSDAAEFRF